MSRMPMWPVWLGLHDYHGILSVFPLPGQEAYGRAMFVFACAVYGVNAIMSVISLWSFSIKRLTAKKGVLWICLLFQIVRLMMLGFHVVFQAHVKWNQLANGLCQCLLFTLVFFQVVYWIDIVNAKISKKSKELWRTFLLMNLVVYGLYGFFLTIVHSTFWINLAMNGICTLGFAAANLKMKHYVHPIQIHQSQLQYFQIITIFFVIVTVYRSMLIVYIHAAFIHNPLIFGSSDAAGWLLGFNYAIPEGLSCSLSLLLMWRMEPKINKFSNFRYSLYSRVRNPFLRFSPPEDPDERLTLLSSPSKNASMVSLDASNEVDMRRGQDAAMGFFQKPQSLLYLEAEGILPIAPEMGRGHEMTIRSPVVNNNSGFPWLAPVTQHVWLSFHCFELKFPSRGNSSFIVVHSDESNSSNIQLKEIGRTEVCAAKNPLYNVMLPIEILNNDQGIIETRSWKISVYAVLNINLLQQLDAQWLIGETTVWSSSLLGKISYDNARGPINGFGFAEIHTLQSPLSRTTPTGTLIVRAEAEVFGASSALLLPTPFTDERPSRITRAFVFVNSEGCKTLVEEDMVESPFTWEIPFQLLQLFLVDALEELHDLQEMLENHRRLLREEKDDGHSTRGLSELVYQIRESAQNKKWFDWRSSMWTKMNEYTIILKNCLEIYGASQHGGLSFKPSTLKRNEELRFLALNLHQQLCTVGYSVATSNDDVCEGSDELQSTYSSLLQSFSLNRRSITQQVPFTGIPDQCLLDDESALTIDFGYPINEENVEKALRQRVISYDSAEAIIQTNQKLPYEQKQLAEQVVALRHEKKGGGDELSLEEGRLHDSTSLSSHGTSLPVMQSVKHLQNDFSSITDEEVDSSVRLPFAKPSLYGTVTTGAFCAHVYGFKHGGIRQLQDKLIRVEARASKESRKGGSGMSVNALEKEIAEIKWKIKARLDVSVCQAVSALVTSFQQTLYIHMHGVVCEKMKHGNSSVVEYRQFFVDSLFEAGFLFSVESLLSTYGAEAGMLEDMDGALRHLRSIEIRLRTVSSAKMAGYRVEIVSGPGGLIVDLPIIVPIDGDATQEHSKSMYRVHGQDLQTGAVYLAKGVRVPSASSSNHSIRVFPVLFTQGINEMQTVANTVGRTALQKQINQESLAVLKEHHDAFAAFISKNEEACPLNVSLRSRFGELLQEIEDNIVIFKRRKNMDILSLTSEFARLVGGGRVTCCKSGKDRTAMSVTLEETNILFKYHDLPQHEIDMFTGILRSNGVRIENARKNIGTPQYCFNSFQNYLLPEAYQCPRRTCGGGGGNS